MLFDISDRRPTSDGDRADRTLDGPEDIDRSTSVATSIISRHLADLQLTTCGAATEITRAIHRNGLNWIMYVALSRLTSPAIILSRSANALFVCLWLNDTSALFRL